MMPRAATLVAALFIASCSGNAAAPAADRQGPAKAQPAEAALPASAPQSGNPQAGAQVTGTVAETMDAGGYTYVRLKTASGEVWAAVSQATLKTGSEVTIGNASWMEGFESKTLNRRFERILFGSLIAPGEATALPPGHPAIAETAAVQAQHARAASGAADVGEVKVEKAQGKDGRTVAEIYASKATLKGTEIAIRGKVVKWNAAILGRNWMHLRDGSGSPEKQDNDLTVTTTELVAKGDVVLVRGKLALDKDFGAGYVYSVILEDAKVLK